MWYLEGHDFTISRQHSLLWQCSHRPDQPLIWLHAAGIEDRIAFAQRIAADLLPAGGDSGAVWADSGR
jgi:hypothetical protein